MNKPTASVAHGCFFYGHWLDRTVSSRKKRIENPFVWHNELRAFAVKSFEICGSLFFKKTQKKSEFFLLFFVFYWEYPLFLQPDLAEQVLKREKFKRFEMVR